MDLSVQLNAVNEGLIKGHLVTKDLITIEKSGIKWRILCLLHSLVKPFYYLGFLSDPWKIDNVAQSVLKLCQEAHKSKNLQQKDIDVAQVVLGKLKEKSAKCEQKKKEKYESSIEKTSDQLKKWFVEINAKNEIAKTLPQDIEVVKKAVTDFSHRLYSHLAKDPKNKSLAISSVSIVSALGMCLNAIPDSEQKAFLKELGLQDLSLERANYAIAEFLKSLSLPASYKEGSIEIAQAMAMKTHVKVSESLKNDLVNVYDAEVMVTDDLKKVVDAWTAKKTKERIKQIVPDDPAITLILINALALDLMWKKPFVKENTVDREFQFVDGSKTPVKMMKMKDNCLVFKGDKFDVLEKTYTSPEGRNLSQIIILPKDPTDLQEVEGLMTPENIQKWKKEGKRIEVNLSMPKTKAEGELELMPILIEMGFPIGLLDEKKVSETSVKYILHKTFVSNDEKGTKAAAVTAIMVEKCCKPKEEEPFEFNMNRSYSYLIVDSNKDVITEIFRGRVNKAEDLLKN